MTTINAGIMAAAFADTMSAAGYEISDQLFNALEKEFETTIDTDQEDGGFTNTGCLLAALEYSAGQTNRALK